MAVVLDAHERTLRRHPDVADRHLGRTGAGAFSLSETVSTRHEAWRVVFSRLTPTAFSACPGGSRPAIVSETSRLLALGTATSLIDWGSRHPLTDTARLARSRGDMLISPSPFTDADRATSSSALPARDVHHPGLAVDRRGNEPARSHRQEPGRGTIRQRHGTIRDSTSARRPTTGHPLSTCSSQQASRRRNCCPRRVWREGISTRRRRWWCSSGSL